MYVWGEGGLTVGVCWGDKFAVIDCGGRDTRTVANRTWADTTVINTKGVLTERLTAPPPQL